VGDHYYFELNNWRMVPVFRAPVPSYYILEGGDIMSQPTAIDILRLLRTEIYRFGSSLDHQTDPTDQTQSSVSYFAAVIDNAIDKLDPLAEKRINLRNYVKSLAGLNDTPINIPTSQCNAYCYI
jgi:hypothetical protein